MFDILSMSKLADFSARYNLFQILAGILYKAAREAGYVDPVKVQEILGVSPEEATEVKDATKSEKPSGTNCTTVRYA